MASSPIKISVRGFAEVVSAASSRKHVVLKRYKFPTSDESVGRSNYYVKALSAIKRHHHGEHAHVKKVLQELLIDAASETDSRKKAKLLNNHRAIADYLKNFGNRVLTMKSGKQLYFIYKNLVVSARPDLVAEENGSLVLIKLNLGKDNYAGGVTSMMLHLLYEAAHLRGMMLKPGAVECLQVSSGSRITGPRSGFPPKGILVNACQEVLDIWPTA